MGHRALVAYRRQDGSFNLHFSGWGADVSLADRISVSTPLGGENDMAPDFVGAMTAALAEATDSDVQVARHMTDADDTAVEPDPMEIGASIDDAIDELNEEAYEMLFVVDSTFVDGETADMDVRAFRVEHDLDGEMILVEPNTTFGEYTDGDYWRGWFRGAKAQCQSLAADGVLDEDEANQRLREQVLEKYADNLSLRLLGRSPAFSAEERAEYPCAFLTMGGRSRVLGEMYPSSIDPAADWELPDDFPSVKTASGDRVEVA